MRAFVGLAVSAFVVVWLSATLVRVENERYALSLGMCRDAATGLSSRDCLDKVQTRTAWYWHLFYALKGA